MFLDIEARVSGESPGRHKENMQTPHRKAPAETGTRSILNNLHATMQPHSDTV